MGWINPYILKAAQDVANEVDHEDHDEAVRVALEVAVPLILAQAARGESTVPVFTGAPTDWWEAAEEITQAEAQERSLGDWYIVKIRNAGGGDGGYRLHQPRTQPNAMNRIKLLEQYGNQVSDRVRCLIRSETPLPAWLTSEFIMADMKTGKRGAWRRASNGQWRCITDGRWTVNDASMAEMNPVPAEIVESLI